MRDNKFTSKQFATIRNEIKLGRILQREHPEIEELYRAGMSIREIVKKVSIEKAYDINYPGAWMGVYRAIIGHDGNFRFDAYEGLITDEEERKRIGSEHRRQNGRRIYEERTGVHGRTLKQMRIDGSKAGKVGGHKTYEEGKGIHGRTLKQRAEDVRRNLEARGLNPWTGEEIRDIYEFSQQKRYQLDYGGHKGSPDYEKIREALIKRGYNGRTKKAIKTRLIKYRKFLEDKAGF